MPTIRGFRRRGYTPESIRNFCKTIGVARFNSTIDMVVLENAVREHLNRTAPRRMGVLRPLKVTLVEGYPPGEEEWLPAVNNPEDPDAGTRQVPFSRELYIERDDFMEQPPKNYFRLAPGSRSSTAICLFRSLRRCCSRPSDGRRRRIEMQLRPHDAWRQCAGRTEGERDHSLGVRPTRVPGGGTAVRSSFRDGRSGQTYRKAAVSCST